MSSNTATPAPQGIKVLEIGTLIAGPCAASLMAAIGRPELADDPRLARNDGRAQHVELIDGAIGAYTRANDLATVLAALQAASVPCDRVYTAADIHADPHVRARRMIESHTLPDGKRVGFPAFVPKLSVTPGQTQWLGSKLGEHTREVLAAIGIDAAAFDALRSQGVV